MKAEEIIPATHRLEQSGMTRNEAEAVIAEMQRVVAPLATRDDLKKLEQSIRSDMKPLATKVELAQMETRLLVRLSAVMLATAGLVLSFLRFFPLA